MNCRKTTALSLCVLPLVITITVCLVGCGRQQEEPQPVAVEQPVKPPPSPITSILPAQQPAINPIAGNETPKPSPPKPEDVSDVLARAYQKAVTPEVSHEPPFVVGDFNGDGSEDLAIPVKPNEAMLGEINSEFANWILEDPRNITLNKGLTNPQPPASERKPVQANKGDVMLAIVHGVGPQGWRNPEAKQAFLLKNGVGSGMATQSMQSLRTSKDKQKLPPLRGDGIKETVGGKSGLILWNGAKYAWYSPGPG